MKWNASIEWKTNGSRRMVPFFVPVILLYSWCCCCLFVEGKFEPYQLNGGLVSAVAGRDYVILASDTRLTDGGYEILTRRHLSSRLWSVNHSPSHIHHHEDVLEFDGSLKVPSSSSSSRTDATNSQTVVVPNGMTMIGSAGCNADCEELKRRMRLESMAHGAWHGSNAISSSSIATLLGQTLYSRRVFPYYSFCVLAGMDYDNSRGVVHVYDAIGSHERVAVASAGTGKEMLQPILDQFFSSSKDHPDMPCSSRLLLRDQGAIDATEQRIGWTTLSPPVQTHVECTLDQAISNLVTAYQSVSEREASVGDTVVLCIMTTKPTSNTSSKVDVNNGKDNHSKITQHTQTNMQILQFPLRKD